MNDSATRIPSRARAWLCFTLAALSYLGVALWLVAPILTEPSGSLLELEALEEVGSKISRLDQQMVLATIVRNASTLLEAPRDLFGYGQCYPFPGSYRLGEHMFGEGVLAVVPWALTRHPVSTFNAVVVLALILPGITMYLLAHRFTGSAAAAFVSGLVLMLAPPRLLDVTGHPYLYADWALPLVLLCLHRLFVTGRWGYALGVAVFLGFEVLETVYVLLAVTVVVAVYGVYGLFAHRDRLSRFVVPLAASALLSLAFAWFVLGPYLDARDTWGTLSGRALSLMGLSEFGPGHKTFPGVVAIVLAFIALVDRARRRRDVEGEDPRWAMLAAIVLVMWAASFGVQIPGTDVWVPGLLESLAGIVPGLDAVRALRVVSVGLFVPLALLAGFGMRALIGAVPARAALGVVVVACLGLVLERRLPEVARWSFGIPTGYAAWSPGVEEADVELLGRVSRGAILHVPMPHPENSVARLKMARDLFLQSFDPRPSSVCYNSFGSPLEGQIHQLASALPRPAAAKALSSLGFGTVVSHEPGWLPRGLVRFRKGVAAQAGPAAAIQDLGKGATVRAYRLGDPGKVTENVLVLHPRPRRPLSVGVGPATLQVGIGNLGPALFRSAMPIQPTEVEVLWFRGAQPVGQPDAARMILPLALAGGETMLAQVEVTTPEIPGEYRVAVILPGEKPHLLAVESVRVEAESKAAGERTGGR